MANFPLSKLYILNELCKYLQLENEQNQFSVKLIGCWVSCDSKIPCVDPWICLIETSSWVGSLTMADDTWLNQGWLSREESISLLNRIHKSWMFSHPYTTLLHCFSPVWSGTTKAQKVTKVFVTPHSTWRRKSSGRRKTQVISNCFWPLINFFFVKEFSTMC